MRNLVWAWDPIGLGTDARFSTWDEYDCIIELIIPLLDAKIAPEEIVARLNWFLPNHFSIGPQSSRCARFVVAAIHYWEERPNALI